MTDVKAVSAGEKSLRETAVDYLREMGLALPQKQAAMFVNLCGELSLNPFKRECYAVGYGDNWSIITGYEVYIKRAERTGKLDGWEVSVEGTGQTARAVITIRRKDWGNPFRHYVLYSEAVQRRKDGSVNSMWEKMPDFMLRKVCIAQGFRLCFPDELGGMPLTADELGAEEPSERDVSPPDNPAPEPSSRGRGGFTDGMRARREEIKEKTDRIGTILGSPLFTDRDREKYRRMWKSHTAEEVLAAVEDDYRRRFRAGQRSGDAGPDAPDWVQIKRATEFARSMNPETEERDYISDERPTTELINYKPSETLSITMYKGADDFDLMYRMYKERAIGDDAKMDFLLVYIFDSVVSDGKTYYYADKTEATVTVDEFNASGQSLSCTVYENGTPVSGYVEIVEGKPVFTEGDMPVAGGGVPSEEEDFSGA